MACPNKNLQSWKDLVGKVGEYEAMSLFIRNEESAPNVGRDLSIPKSGIVSYQQKINILGRLKKYNSKLGTKHLLKFVPTGEMYEGKREYSYVVSLVENWNRSTAGQTSMFQDIADKKDKRDARIEDKMRVFLETIGVEYKTVNEINDREGNPLGFVAKANMVNKVVEVVEDRAGIDTLPEEAAHFFVNILEAQGDPLVTSMMNNIDKYKVYDEVASNPNYQNQPLEMIKKEAIGKAIAKHILNKDEENEISENISRLERWFTRIFNKVKKFLKIPTANPYAKSALAILNNELQENSSDLITEEQIELGDFYQDSPQDKQSEILKLLDDTATDLVSKAIQNDELAELMKAAIDLPEGQETMRYYSQSKGKWVQGRVSDGYQAKLLKRMGKEWMRDINSRPVNEHKRNQGTIHHSTMQSLVDFYAGNTPQTERNLKKIKDQAMYSVDTGERVMSPAQWNVMHKNVQSIVNEIKKQQRDINKETGTKGKVSIKAEAMLYAPAEDKGKYFQDTAGTVDLLAIFSDGTASIYDWKFISPKQVSGFGQKAKIMDSPFGMKEDGYNMQLGAYKSILQNFYKVKTVRKSRIIPIHVQYKWKGMKGEKVITPVLDTLRMAFDVEKDASGKVKLKAGDSYLRPIPVADELTNKPGLDKLLSAQMQKRLILKNKLESEKNYDKKQAIKYKIEKIDIAIRQMQLNGDIYDLFAGAGSLVKELEKRLHIQDKEDPNYIHMDEFNDFYNEIAAASLLTGDSVEYLKELKDSPSEKELYKKLTGAMKEWNVPITQMLETLRENLASRVIETADNVGVSNATRAQREFGLSKLWADSATHSHPIFQTAYRYINKAKNTIRKAEKQVYSEIQERMQDIRDNFGNVKEAYKLMINPETGNLHAKIKKEFWEAKAKAIEEGNATWMRKTHKLKDNAAKRHDQRKKWAFDSIDRNYPDFDAIYEGQILVAARKSQKQIRDINKAGWMKFNSLDSDLMWTGPNAYIYTELKDEVVKEQYSDEYLVIRDNPALSKFYDYYQAKNREFSELTGMKFADNFVGNIHRDVIDGISEGSYSIGETLNRALSSLHVRQDEVTPESIDENGNLIKSIPILYTTPGSLVDPATGRIDLNLKSTDLGQSLQLMATVVHNYVEKSKIESINLALLNYLQDNKTAILPTDSRGGLLNYISGQVAKITGDQTAADHFERMYVKHALYNQTIQSKDYTYLDKYSMNKTASTMKTWYSANALGFAFIPALAAGVVGTMAIWIEGKKGTAFTSKQFLDAEGDILTNRTKYEAFTNYFEIWQEDMSARRNIKLASGLIGRYVNLDTLFMPFRKADNVLDNVVLNAMMRNWGATEQGMPKRLSELPEGNKSLYDLWEVDQSNGGVHTGLSEEGEINFREKVQYVTGSIKGSMRSDTVTPIDTMLIGSLIMQFKGWAPRLLQERFGEFRFNPVMDSYEKGRYGVVWNELVDTELTLLEKLKDTSLKFGQLAVGTMTFGLYKGMEMNEERAEKEYEKVKMLNQDDPNIQNMTKEQFYDMKRSQLRGFAAELKALLSMWIAMFAMGREGDDGEPIYNHTWFTRKLNMILHKSALELGFALNPADWTQVFRTPIPLTGLAVDFQKALRNFTTESRELMSGKENKRDKTDFGYYTFRLIPGFKQMSRWTELYETDKQNPYTQKGR